MLAIGIPNVGVKTARDLARHFGTLDAVRHAGREELLSIPDIGEIVADSIRRFFDDPAISAELDALLAHGVCPLETEPVSGELPLGGKTLAVTGTLPSLSRRDAEALIEKHGGKCAGSVSKNTSFLLAGESAGSKLDKAKALGVPVIDEAEFMQMIGNAL